MSEIKKSENELRRFVRSVSLLVFNFLVSSNVKKTTQTENKLRPRQQINEKKKVFVKTQKLGTR